MLNCAKIQSQWDLRVLLQKIKEETKILQKVQSSNKAKKQMFEAKTVIEIKL